jgi:hypothetical protein
LSDALAGFGPCTVSVILPVYNEAGIIERTVTSLIAQELDPGVELEILVIDGQSTDGSRELVQHLACRDHRVRLVSNPHRTAPCAFNIGLRAARGAYVCILGAHCVYAPDYISVCLRELLAHDAVGCSGKTITCPAGTSLSARLAGWALSHPFGVSGSSFRTQSEGYVDTIPYPVFRTAALLQLGGYNEAMTRNQDNDMNYRLRQAGHKLYCTWKTSCEYRAKGDVSGLMDYARAMGFWCGISARTSPLSLGLRHYVPFSFLVVTLLGIVLLPAAWRLSRSMAVLPVLPLTLHLLLGHLASLALAVRERSWRPVLLPWVFLAFHLTYGFAFARGLVSSVAPRALRRA